MATMAMPVTGATAVAPRASLRAKASVRGARVVARLRPAAVRERVRAVRREDRRPPARPGASARIVNIGSPGLVSTIVSDPTWAM